MHVTVFTVLKYEHRPLVPRANPARSKIFDHGFDLRKRAALGGRTPDLRITRDVITAYTVLTQSIGARHAVQGAQPRRR